MTSAVLNTPLKMLIFRKFHNDRESQVKMIPPLTHICYLTTTCKKYINLIFLGLTSVPPDRTIDTQKTVETDLQSGQSN